MSSVTQRVKQVKQPYGGYIKPSKFDVIQRYDNLELYPEENIHAVLVGIVVDYLSRYMITKDVLKSFHISCIGAKIIGKDKIAKKLLREIKGLDDNSIVCACKLGGFDVCVRGSVSGYKPIEKINPDKKTIHNIRVLVERTLSFWKENGPIEKDGFTFEGGYTKTIDSGDGDYLTKDTLWDLKVSKKNPTSKHTLQLLIYYIMGMNSIHNYFDNIRFLGIYNPRLNVIFKYNLKDTPITVIEEVRDNVIGYANPLVDLAMEQTMEHKLSNKELSIQEVADILDINKSKVYRLIKTGDLYAVKNGNRYIIKRKEIEKYKKRKKIRTYVAISMLFFFAICMVYLLVKIDSTMLR